jgi:dolichol-phosphate mannosyltransferase
MRRFGTGLFQSTLFQSGLGLYKARAAHGRPFPPGRRTAERDRDARRSLWDNESNWNVGMGLSLSVVVPVMNEAENVAPLAREIAAAVPGDGATEIIFIDDGSSDGTAAALSRLKDEIPGLRVLQHAKNAGQSRAVRTGVRAARAQIVVTLDGDGQNDPADIPRLVAVFEEEGPRLGLVAGVRKRRQDSAAKRLASRAGNRFRNWMLADGATDTGCGLKAFRRDAFLALPYFDHIHRFLIALMLREGYDVRYVEVGHRPRTRGVSKYGVLDRALVGITDLLGVRWLQRRFRGGALETREI